jgi:penicillin-binding protein 1A
MNLVRAYAVFCAQGVASEPIFITRILSRDGTVLEDNRPRLAQAISPETAFLITSMLQSVVEEGTGKKVRALNRPCAGKTGTTNDVRDAWFVGFTPQLVAGVWLGFDDLSPLGKRETGAVAASPVWLDFMQQALQNEPVQTFRVPEGIIYVKVNPKTGLPPASGESGVFECFRDGTAPGMTMPGGAADTDNASGLSPETEPLPNSAP